jgi:hypothetical protein
VSCNCFSIISSIPTIFLTSPIPSFKYFPIVFVSQIPTHFASFFLSHDQPSVASDLDHCQFKMPGKCKFLNKWLEQPQYHAWLRNSPDIHKAHCKCCNKSFDISSMMPIKKYVQENP